MSSLGDIIGLLAFGALRVEITNEIDVISHDFCRKVISSVNMKQLSRRSDQLFTKEEIFSKKQYIQQTLIDELECWR